MSWASVDMWRWITAAHSEVDPTHYANKIQYTCVFVFEMPSLPTFTPWAFKTRTCNRKCTGLQVIADNTQTLSQAHVHSLSVDVCFLCVCVSSGMDGVRVEGAVRTESRPPGPWERCPRRRWAAGQEENEDGTGRSASRRNGWRRSSLLRHSGITAAQVCLCSPLFWRSQNELNKFTVRFYVKKNK